MGRPSVGLLAMLAAAGTWLLLGGGPGQELSVPLADVVPAMAGREAGTSRTDTIRLATLDLGQFGSEQIESRDLMDLLSARPGRF